MIKDRQDACVGGLQEKVLSIFYMLCWDVREIWEWKDFILKNPWQAGNKYV